MFRIGVPMLAFCLYAQGQNPPAGDASSEVKGMPPRAAAADYQAQAKAGTVTVAAEFKGHAVPTALGPLTSEDYVAVEIGFYGPAGARLTLSAEDFALRVNGKKTALPSLPYGLVAGNVKDPEWVPEDAAPTEKKSKTSMGGSGQEKGSSNDPPPVVKVPVPVLRALAQRVHKASLPEGDRPLPVSGLIYFAYRGKTTGIRELELTYSGPAGKVSLKLEP